MMMEKKLLQQAANGDASAFQLLYEYHHPAVFRFAYRMLICMGIDSKEYATELAADITQDCFLSLIKDPERFDPSRASLRTYLCAAARNLSIKALHRMRKEADTSKLAEHQSEAQGPLSQLLDDELSHKLINAIKELTPLQQQALILFEWEELSLAEIATIVETDVGTVKARLFRARERLRNLFSSYLGGSNNPVSELP